MASDLCTSHNNNGAAPGGRARPVSFYDNMESNGNSNGPMTNGNNNGTTVEVRVRETKFIDATPTQAHCLTTTVPQNITAPTIAHKHTPTRNSLRHSRMIALNTHGRVPRKYLPAIFRYHKLAKAILGLLVLLGSALCVLSLWFLVWTPNLRPRDNPYWSGIPVLLSSIIGLILLCCCRKERPGMKRSYFVYAFKVLSITLSCLAAVASFTACTFAVIHLISLYTMACAPRGKFETTCVCEAPSTPSNLTETVSSSLNVSSPSATSSQSYHYVDLTCLEVENILTILVIFSSASTLLAGVLEIWYIYLHWASRYVYTYSKVRTEENKPTVFTNNSS